VPKVSDEHKEAIRRRILDAALVCLERSGYRDLTTRELLAEAGLSVGTFYNYFPSKEHLYEALAEEALSVDVERILSGSARSGAIGGELIAFLDALAGGDPSGAIAVASFRGRMQAGPEAAEAIARLNEWVIDAFTPLVQRAQAEGSLRPELDTQALVEMIDIIWDGLGRRAATDSFQTSYERVGKALLAVLQQGLPPQGSSSTSTAGTEP
jgi:AcrR family transcriptional regulator